jgi:hypothetical protein
MKKLILLLTLSSCMAQQKKTLPKSVQSVQIQADSSKVRRIAVCNVKRAESLLPEVAFQQCLMDNIQLDDVKLISHSRDSAAVAPAPHLFHCVYSAYAGHRPLVLSPDMIWLQIVQGFTSHLDKNAEKLRYLFVSHEGKEKLKIQVPMFPPNVETWEGHFKTFKSLIGDKTKQNIAETLATPFSTTRPDEQVAFDIALMSSMKNYFSYGISIICGIPEIHLEGTVADWQNLEKRTAALAQYDLEWWVDDLKPILAEFTKAAQGGNNTKFWEDIIRIRTESVNVVCGTEQRQIINGWITRLYPYLSSGGRNPALGTKLPPSVAATKATEAAKELEINFLSELSGVTSCDLEVDDNGYQYKLKLHSGFFGMRQAKKSKAVRPVISWAITTAPR